MLLFLSVLVAVILTFQLNEKSLAILGKQPEKKPRKSEEIAKRMENALAIIRSDPTVSRASLAKKLGITDSQAKTALSKLRDNGTIRREGSDTDGYWIVNADGGNKHVDN